MTDWKLCSGSGAVQMLAWQPVNDYPGAVVCLECSGGIMVVKGSVEPATSEAGYEGLAGMVRRHYVNDRSGRITMRRPAALKPDKKGSG